MPRFRSRLLLSMTALTAALGIVACNPLQPVAPSTTKPTSTTATSTTATSTTATSTTGSLATPTRPWFGVLQADPAKTASFTAAGVNRVSLEVGWDSYQPTATTFNTAYAASLRSRIAAWKAAGYQVVLDPGLQYPPSWVFSLPGQTRYVNQYGDTWHGVLSEDLPNAVYNTAVRNAQATYLQRLSTDLGSGSFTAVRVGGLLSGELRYPPSTYNGHKGSIWNYDAAAQAKAPVAGWRPGSGTTAQATTALQYYFDSLTGYEKWLIDRLGAGFPSATLQLMLPSWGLRPGAVQNAVNDRLQGRTVAEQGGMISAGLDWTNQVRVLAESRRPAEVYSTWVDAPSQGTSLAQISPIDYLATLAAPRGLPLAGENTGGGGTAALELSLTRVKALHLRGLMWMNGPNLVAGAGGVTLPLLHQRLTATGMGR